jgi:hypothetical protein
MVKKTCGDADSISLKCIVLMRVWQRHASFTVQTRRVEIPNHNKRKIVCIKLVFEKEKLINSKFRFCLRGKVMVFRKRQKWGFEQFY